ncbi:hypothetical protein LINGRAHAP2_LOCUS8489, partial [Linum grandiflorum]
ANSAEPLPPKPPLADKASPPTTSAAVGLLRRHPISFPHFLFTLKSSSSTVFYPETVFASFRSPGHFRAQFPSTLRMATSSRPAKRPRQTIDLHSLRPAPVPEEIQQRCFNFTEPRFIN